MALLDIPMLGMDASMVLCYRDEYAKILADKLGDFNVLLAHEWLLSFIQKDTEFKVEQVSQNTRPFKLFAHCTEK